ncbi:hypothetical protein DKX38_006518 [Salix brachista]|uniref:SHSP domain-containing protein n=1 Tax=Salix brachista TaxID=2182728 RepID=A0A5N5N531_9ROSI|nr:hypothetical protein DKX38_006518 [Salix brachista]
MDLVAKADDFEKKAEKKLNGWGIFGSKYEDAADLFDKAAKSSTGDRKLKINGKSHQGDNKFIRFNTVPPDYDLDLDQIRAEFEGGVLFIKHPKKNISPAIPMDSTKPMDKVYDHVYEDVGSTTEWVKEAGIDSLHVHLTEGVCSSCSPHSSMFQQVRVQASGQKLKITRKRRRGVNEWIRFNKEVNVPSDFLIFLQNPSKVGRQNDRKTIQSQLQDLKSLQMINHKTK